MSQAVSAPAIPTWRANATVTADKITAIAVNGSSIAVTLACGLIVNVAPFTFGRSLPAVGDYLIKHNSRYHTSMPAAQFEAAYAASTGA